MYNAVNKNKEIRRYIESLSLHTGAPAVNLEDIKSYIYIVEAKIVTLRVKHIDIPDYFNNVF